MASIKDSNFSLNQKLNILAKKLAEFLEEKDEGSLIEINGESWTVYRVESRLSHYLRGNKKTFREWKHNGYTKEYQVHRPRGHVLYSVTQWSNGFFTQPERII